MFMLYFDSIASHHVSIVFYEYKLERSTPTIINSLGGGLFSS